MAHPLDKTGSDAARALLDDPSPYWREAACAALVDAVRQDKTPSATLRAMLEAIAGYNRDFIQNGDRQ